MPQAAQPYQKGQLQLALALNYERSGQLEKVFAEASPVQEPLLRSILLRNVADAALLRRQAKQGATAEERDTALFTLLYKDLRRSRFADFGKDFALLGETPRRPSWAPASAMSTAPVTAWSCSAGRATRPSPATFARPSPSRPRRWPPMTRTRRA